MDLHTFQKWQQESETTFYPGKGTRSLEALVFMALGIVGEAGEVAEIIKKFWRTGETFLSLEETEAIAKELGDVMWYMAGLANELGVHLESVLAVNKAKAESRFERGVVCSEGDDR